MVGELLICWALDVRGRDRSLVRGRWGHTMGSWELPSRSGQAFNGRAAFKEAFVENCKCHGPTLGTIVVGGERCAASLRLEPVTSR
ncbi:hypothetical protein DPMN_182202 [Dreissena polymorpha]|uniref:Uncharacterized protein n=1 Tax=Dreissena polymorpha TaxID=45954 RepID=A0A9D4DGP4_DREPO|nr:hypothetical protein DPMN_182202 [Dreissena polymorpha]